MFETKTDEFFTEYNKYLKSNNWYLLRLTVLKRDNFKCRYCKSRKAEQVHHLSYENYKLTGHSTIDECVSVCTSCHHLIHSGKVGDYLRHNLSDKFEPYEITGLMKTEDGLIMCPACHGTKIRECATYFLDGKDSYTYLEEGSTYTVIPFHCENGHGFCFLIGSKQGHVATQIIGNKGTTFTPLDWMVVFKGTSVWDCLPSTPYNQD